MSFLAPGWLVLGALTLFVLVLHMRRRRQIAVPSLLLWRLLETSAAQRRSLRRPQLSLLLLLQLLIVLMLVLALAQPLFGTNRASVHTIYVLDSSGSMRATDVDQSRFDAAVGRLGELIEVSSARPGNRVSVITAGAQARILVARQAVSASIVPMIDGLRAGDGPADWEGTAALLAALVGDEQTPAVVVLTDGADAAESTLAAAFPDLSVKRATFAGDDIANVGLTAKVVPDDAEADKWNITGTVRFGGAEPDSVTVQALFRPQGGGGFVEWSETEVSRGDADDAAFSLALELPGPGDVLVQLPQDAGPQDDAAYFVLRAEPGSAKILYLGDTYRPLIAALQSLDNVEVTAADQLPGDDGVFDLVIVDGVAVSRRPATNVLWLGEAQIADQPAPMAMRDPYVTGWSTDHPLSDGVDWTAVSPRTGYLGVRLSGAKVLAEWAGVPLVQARTTPVGREVRISFDLRDSDWSERAGFPVFVANLVRWLGIDLGAVSGPSCIVGAPCPIESRLLQGSILAPDGAEAWSPAPAGADYLLPGIEHTFVPDRAGFYRLAAGDQLRLLAVNAAAGGETALAQIDDGEAAVLSTSGISPWIWWWFLGAALIILLAEAWIAGRGPEQFLKRTALAADNPLALRRRLQVGVRAAACAFLLAAILGLPIPNRQTVEQVVVVVGADLGPDSQNPGRDRVLREVETNRASAVGGEPAGIVATGAANRVAADLGDAPGDLPADAFRSPGPGANLEQALQLAAAMVPADRAGRVVLAADGNETVGELAKSLTALRKRGLTVDIQPLTELPLGEVLVESVSVPARVYAGDLFALDAIVYSQGSARATVTVKRAGDTVQEQEVDLLAGRNRVETVIPAGDSGSLLLEVSVAMAGDTFAQNNIQGVFVEVAPSPAIAIIAPEPEAGEFLAQALQVQGLTAAIMSPSEAPDTMDGWLEYDSVVLMNVPAISLDTDQQEMVEKLVQVNGRGLLILGGENSFGPGGYYETPFERASPLSSRVPHDAPQVALVYVLDRSGSMVGAVDEAGLVTRLNIAKQATITAVSLLNAVSRVGIVVFDTKAHIILPMQEHRNEEGVALALQSLVPGGGTSILPGLKLAIDMLVTVDAAARHIVVMTDGLSQDADFSSLIAKANRAEITISAIAIGGAADIRQPQDIAQRGGGAFYATEDFKALPSILAQETLILLSSPVQQRTAPVSWADRSANFLAGLPAELPPVRSYVRTTVQPEAELHLTVTEEDGEVTPLLASWRYGNGRVLAFATHGAGAGTEEWIKLPEYPLMWAQAIRHFLPDAPGPGLHIGLHRSGDSVRIIADALDEDGEPMREREVSATIAAATGAAASLDEVRPGRYEGSFVATAPGVYRVTVEADELTREAMMYVGYPARFNFVRSDFDKLQALAAATGGKMLLGDTSMFGDKLEWVARSKWRPWALVALALFMLDLAIRHVPGVFGLRKRSGA